MVTTVENKRETVSLIGSDKVDGTAVYGADERKIGTVQRVTIDKISGKVAYAVPDAVAKLEIRHPARRLPRRRHGGSNQGRAKI